MTLLDRAEALAGGKLLRQILVGMLRSSAPKIILWGPQFHTFFNEAYAALDPAARMARSGERVDTLLPETWMQFRHHLDQALGGTERLSAQVMLPGDESGQTPALRYTAYLTPLYGEGPHPQGVLVDVHETTKDRLLSRRLLVEMQQLQYLFSELPVLMAYGQGEELRLHFVNTAFRRFFGFRPLDGLTMEEALPEAADQGFAAVLEEVLATGQPFIGKGLPLRLGAGSQETVHYLDFIYQPVRDPSGRITGVLCTGIDVTETHRSVRESESRTHRALHASRVNAMATMALTLAHELNQPLAAAASYLSAARRLVQKACANDEQSLAMLSQCAAQISRAGKIIRRAQPLVHSAEADRRPVSVQRAIDNALSLMTAEQDLHLTVSRDIPATANTVLADEIQLEQVLVNLFRNAVQAATAARRPEIAISSRPLRFDRVRITVRDFGKGLEGKDTERIFELGRSGSGNGLGIGLPLSRTLIEANCGSLWAENAPGGGAEFFIELERAPTGQLNS